MNKLKIYLDDCRPTPEGFIGCKWPEEVIALLQKAEADGDIVTHLSLDHDLGLDKRNGYDVLLWIEEQVFTRGFIPPTHCIIHTDNASARDKMMMARATIYQKCLAMGINYKRR